LAELKFNWVQDKSLISIETKMNKNTVMTALAVK